MKKALSLILVLTMLSGVLAILPGFAAEADAEPSISTPEGTPISSVEEFVAMAADGIYYLTKDIDFGDVNYSGGNIAPKNFSGMLDGQGHSLLNITVEAASDTGVFGVNFKGTLKNITIGAPDDVAKFTCTVGGKAVGAVASTCQSGATFENVTVYTNLQGGDNKTGTFGGYVGNAAVVTLTNCHVYGEVKGTPASGFIANQRNDAPVITFTNCSNNASVTNAVNNSCPVAGFYANKWEYESTNVHTLTFINCTNNGTITSGTNTDRNCAAGFVCGNSPIVFDLTFKNCRNNGSITGTNGTAAGFATIRQDGNRDETSKFSFESCVNTATVTAKDGVGAAAGILALPRQDITAEISIKNCLNTGDIVGGNGSAGGIFTLRADGNNRGKKCDVTVIGCANYGTVSATDWRAGGIIGILGMGNDSTLSVSHCYNAGTISCPGHVAAGIVGEMTQFDACTGTRTVEYCYNVGTLIGNSMPQIARVNAGGQASLNFVKNCYYEGSGYAATTGDITVENTYGLDGNTALFSVLKDLPTAEDGTTFVEDRVMINMGYPLLSWQLPASTKAPAFSEGSIDATAEPNSYTIDSTGISGFISARAAGDSATDIRFVLAADLEALKSYEALSLTVEFATAEGVVKTLTVTEKDITLFATATGAGNSYAAGEGAVLFGIVITGVPNDAWDYAVLSVSTTEDGAPAMAGVANRATILG